MGDASVCLKYRNKFCKDMLAETHLIVKSPVMPVNKFINPLLTRQPRCMHRHTIELGSV
jgi:hypothetical protein